MDPLLTVDGLAAELTRSPPVLLDVRWRLVGPPAREDYLSGHLPGAVFVDLDAELAGPPGEQGRHPLPDPAALQQALRRWGISEGTHVVAYDDAGATSAARAWWLLRWAGHTRVQVLDGGLRAWIAAGHPLDKVLPQPTPGDFVVRPGQLPVLDAAGAADAARAGPPGEQGRHPLPDPAALQQALRRWGISEGTHVVAYDDAGATSAARAWWLLRWAGHTRVQVLDGGLRAWIAAGHPLDKVLPQPTPGDFVVRPGQLPVLDAAGAADAARAGLLLDARAEPRYLGDVEPIDPVAGHIPGAISAPALDNIDADGAFRTPEQLRHRFAGLGVDGTRPVGVYCGSGVVAAQQVLALHRIGISAVLYAGSWSEWITDPSRLVASGAGS